MSMPLGNYSAIQNSWQNSSKIFWSEYIFWVYFYTASIYIEWACFTKTSSSSSSSWHFFFCCCHWSSIFQMWTNHFLSLYFNHYLAFWNNKPTINNKTTGINKNMLHAHVVIVAVVVNVGTSELCWVHKTISQQYV